MPLQIRVPTTTLGLFLMVAAAANAQPSGQLLAADQGVELRGSVERVMPGGGTCHVSESDGSYEERRHNDGASMDLWRVDLQVRNGSGRWLDRLSAIALIDSEVPECTDWDAPTAGPFGPDVRWSRWQQNIQEVGRNVVSPDQVLTETQYYITLASDPPPRITMPSVLFTFAVAPPADRGPATGAVESQPAGQASAATPEQENLFWQSVADSTNPAELEAYLAQFPNGVFRALAEARLAALRAGSASGPPVDRLSIASTFDSGDLDFGDDTGPWAEDGECDDPRFEGPGMGLTDSEANLGHDATDCRELFETGRVSLIDVELDFGDDASAWARDGECDDPRFEGPGMGLTDSEEDRGHDATDCRTLHEAGRISLMNVDAAAQTPNPAAAGGQAHLLVWSAEPSDEHARIHIYIDGEWQVNRDVWYTWDGPPPDCNYRETYPEGVANFANFYLESGQYRLRAAATRRGGFDYDDHGFGPDIVFAIEETLDLQPGCNVFEIVRP